MECSICLNECTNCTKKTLLCNHVFHTDCIKEWFMKGDDCPLCRGKLYFRGMFKTNWHTEKANQVVGTSIETIFNEIVDDFHVLSEKAPKFVKKFLARSVMEELRNSQITYNILREDGVDDETIYDAISDGLYMSPRIKYLYLDEKTKKKYSKYSKQPRMGKNVRIFY